MRATTDEMAPIDMLRLVAEEVLACGKRVDELVVDDAELREIWRSYEQVCQVLLQRRKPQLKGRT